MRKLSLLIKMIMVSAIFFWACEGKKPLKVVPSVDMEQYMGRWYEIATIPQRFQKGCNCTTAEYTLTDNKFVKVVNTCKKDSVNGPVSQIEGKAFIAKKGNGAKLKVQFFWPFKAKYWIIDLAEDYSWAVVGHPNRKYLWILSRTPQLDESTYKAIIKRLELQEYNTNLLVRTKQDC